MKKKAPQKHTRNHFDSTIAARSIIGLLIVLLAAAVLALFITYQDTIIATNMFYPFMFLTFIGMGLLISLLFLVNPSHKK